MPYCINKLIFKVLKTIFQTLSIFNDDKDIKQSKKTDHNKQLFFKNNTITTLLQNLNR